LDNAWNVQFIEEGVVKIRVFEGNSPKPAVDFAKEQRRRGLVVDVEVFSRRSAFPPPAKQLSPPRAGLLWCPYCVKWREFEESIIVRPDYETPPHLRCPVCTISIRDYYVRRYNPDMVARMEVEAELKKTKVPNKKVQLRRRR